MVLTLTNDSENISEKSETSAMIDDSLFEEQIEVGTEQDCQDWSEEDEFENLEEYEDESEQETRDFSQNQVQLNFSWSLMNQLRNLARNEGISVEDLLIELVAEGATRRTLEDQSKPAPSHLMTRNGYVHNMTDGNTHHTQPQLSHHSLNNGRMQNTQQMRNKNNNGRNNNYNNRYNNSNGRNYQGNNRSGGQGNTVAFRQNNSYNNQNRYNQRNNSSSFYSNQGNSNQRYSNENAEGMPQTQKNKKY